MDAGESGLLPVIRLQAFAFRLSQPAHESLIKADGGGDEIRAHEALLEPAPLAGERLRPLGHLSAPRPDRRNFAPRQGKFGLHTDKDACFTPEARAPMVDLHLRGKP